MLSRIDMLLVVKERTTLQYIANQEAKIWISSVRKAGNCFPLDKCIVHLSDLLG